MEPKTYNDYKRVFTEKYPHVVACDEWESLICREEELVLLFGKPVKFEDISSVHYSEVDIDDYDELGCKPPVVDGCYKVTGILKVVTESYSGWEQVIDHTFNPDEVYFTLGNRLVELFNELETGRTRSRHHALKLSIGYRTNPVSTWTNGYEEPRYEGLQEYTAMLDDKEWDEVRLGVFGSEYYSLEKNMSGRSRHRIEKEVKMKLDSTLQRDCSPVWIEYWLASGERKRLTAGMRYIDEKDICLMKSRLEMKGEGISREELLCGLEDCFIHEEKWTRETGGLWTKYSLLKRTPSQDEYDYADTWDFYPVRLSDFSKESIVEMLNAINK